MNGYFGPNGHDSPTSDPRPIVDERRVEVMARSRDEALVIAVDQAREEFRQMAEARGVTVEFHGFKAVFSDGDVLDMELEDVSSC